MKTNVMNHFLNTVWLVFVLNVCLIVTNPLIVTAFFITGSLKLVCLGIGGLLVAPSLNASLFMLNNPVEEKILRTYFSRYGREFKEAVILGVPNSVFLIVLMVDLFGLTLFPKFQSMSPFFLILLVLGVLFYFYQVLFFVNFDVTIKASFKFALHLFLNKMAINGGVIVVQFMAVFIAQRYMNYFVLIGFSGTLFLMNLIVKGVITNMKQTVNLHEGGMTFEHF